MEELSRLAEMSRTRPVKREGDLCIGMLPANGEDVLIWSEKDSKQFCLIAGHKARKLGYLPREEVRAFIEHYRRAETADSSKEDPSAGSDGDSGAVEEAVGTEGGVPPPETNPAVGMSAAAERFFRGAETYIEKGTADPGLRRKAAGESYTILPDGRIVFKEKPAADDPSPLWGLLLGNPATAVATAFVCNKLELCKIPSAPMPILSRKQRKQILKSTFERRVQQARIFRGIAQSRSLASIEGELTALWNESRCSLAEKKRTLFERWDECLEEGVDTWEEANVLAGAEMMRTMILQFIRRHLPPDSPQAYTPQELASLRNIRSSRQPFEPYKVRAMSRE